MNKVIYHGRQRPPPFVIACVLSLVAVLAALCLVLSMATSVQAASGYHDDLDEQTRIPRLVGYGCKGSKGPLFANEEDHFPRCKAIEAWR